MSTTLNGRAKLSVTPHTANYTLTAKDNGTAHSSKGASGTITATLPAATPGLHFYFYVGEAQEHRIDPAASEVMQLPSTGVGQTGGNYLTANAVGESVHIACYEAGVWTTVSYVGTWTSA